MFATAWETGLMRYPPAIHHRCHVIFEHGSALLVCEESIRLPWLPKKAACEYVEGRAPSCRTPLHILQKDTRSFCEFSILRPWETQTICKIGRCMAGFHYVLWQITVAFESIITIAKNAGEQAGTCCLESAGLQLSAIVKIRRTPTLEASSKM